MAINADKIVQGKLANGHKTKEVSEISQSIVVFIPKESEMNTLSFLP